MKIDIDQICTIAREAGDRIMDIYRSGNFNVETKSDDSPLTIADKASHDIIVSGLKRDYPVIPVLSEEGSRILHDERMAWDPFWLVDPLDGTKEFINRNEEFTVNIALIKSNRPVAGVIYAPVLDVIYFADESGGAFKKDGDESAVPLSVTQQRTDRLIAVKSRSHSSDEETRFFDRLGVTDYLSVGSSLKFCMVAEGKAHLYYRHGPTMEWDTAAGHAIARGAGALVSGLRYNKPVLKNGSFTVSSFPMDPGPEV